MNSGVYYIQNTVNHKIYVGCSKHIKRRLAQHKCLLIKGKHDNSYLQISVNKYGIDNFFFNLLITCDKEDIYKYEDFWCRLLKTHDSNFGYNLLSTSNEQCKTHSESTKLIIKNKHLGRRLTEEWKNKIGQSNRGYKRSKSHIAKMSRIVLKEDLQGNILSEYISLREAARENNISLSKLFRCVQSTTKSPIEGICFKYAKNRI